MRVDRYCFVRDNTTLREALKLRLKEFSLRGLCKELDIDYMNTWHFLQGTRPRGITQWDLWRLCGKIGVRIDVKITFTDER